MQQIERYGVIALVFLLVTIVAVSFWGDSKSPGFWSRLTGRGDAKKMEIAKSAPTAERAVDNALPLTVNPPAGPIETAPQTPPPAAPNQPLAPTAQSAIANANPPAGAAHLPGNPPAPMNMVPGGQAPSVAAAQPPQALPSTQPAPTVTEPMLSAKDTHKAVKVAATPSPSAASTSSSTSGSSMEYVVQKGDSLASIAQKNLGSSSRWTEIQSMNGGIQPKALRVGTKLKLPVTTTAKSTTEKIAPKLDAAPAKKSTPTATESAPAGTVYVVHAGDTLRTIAEKKLGSADRWKDIVAANPGMDAHKLVVGRSLKLPAGEVHEAHEPHTLVAAAIPANASSSSGKPHVR